MVKDKLSELISNFSNQLEAKSEQLTDKYKTLLDDHWRDMHKKMLSINILVLPRHSLRV